MPASTELIKVALQAYGDRYSEIALALADPEIRWDERGSRPDAEPVAKRDAVEKAMRAYLRGWKTYSFELEDVAEVAPGRAVVGICRERGVDAHGQAVDRRFGALWVIKEGKIVSWTTYGTPRDAVKAARELNGDNPPLAKPAESLPEPAPAQRPMAAVPTPPGHEAPPTADDEKRRRAKARANLQRRQRRAAS